jgi:uncharacterized secreted protein with C-terminal beta-propeller domain
VKARRLVAALALATALAVPALADGASRAKPRAFASCTAVGDYARKHALRIVEPDGLPLRFDFATAAEPAPGPPAVDDGSQAPASPQPEAAPPREGTDYSGTNVQEEGVDEPDFVKTDGKRLYVMAGGVLNVLDVTGDDPKLLGSLQLKGFGHQLLVSGDRVLALTTYFNDPVLQPQPEPQPGPETAQAQPIYPAPYAEPATRLFEIDVSDPAAPRLLNTLTVEGFYVSARLRQSVARVVVSTPPSPWVVEDQTVAEQKEAIRSTKLSTWVPDGVLRDRIRRTRRVRRMVACDDIRKPASFSGPGTLTVLTVDLEKGLKPLDSDSLMTDAQTIYASKRNLYVATERWFDPGRSDPGALVDDGRFTAIHRFGIADPQSAEYRASGQVRGFVLNQFSLSEHDGNLRVATTEQPPWREGAEQRQSESFVTVLGEDAGTLRELGRVGGLGKGERIYAVRFMGDAGYVVTFRQVDPLYTLDLSNPAKPAVRGELKLPGFSSYLHPVGDDLLLGLGQDADDAGRTHGTQLSLFDVSDLSAPRRLHQYAFGDGSTSEAEYDHHAFLYWPPTKLAVIPLTTYRQEDAFTGAVGLAVDPGKGITERGRAQHEGAQYAYQSTIRRSLVVGGRLLTISDVGVLSSTLDTLAPGGFATLAAPDSG